MNTDDDLLMRKANRYRRLRDLHTRMSNLEMMDRCANEWFVLPPVAAFRWQHGPINPPREMRERAMLELWGGVITRATHIAEDAVEDATHPDASATDIRLALELIDLLGRLENQLEAR